MSSMSTNTYRLGSTTMAVGLSSVAQFIPPNFCNGVYFKILSGAGTLAITNSAAGPLYSSGLYPVGATETINLDGPASFYLVAAAATMVVAVGVRYSSNGMTQIAGG